MPTSQVVIYVYSTYDLQTGTGNWAAILRFEKQEKELKGHAVEVSAARLELLAVVNVLHKLTKPFHVIFHTESEYVHTGVTKHLSEWSAKDWQVEVDDIDLWRELDKKINAIAQIEWQWGSIPAGESIKEHLECLIASTSEITTGNGKSIRKTKGRASSSSEEVPPDPQPTPDVETIAAQTDVAEARQQLRALRAEIEQTTFRLQEVRDKRIAQNQVIQTLEIHLDELTSTIDQLKQEKLGLSDQVAQLSIQHQQLQEQIEIETAKRQRTKQINRQADSLKQEVDHLTMEKQIIQKQKDDLYVLVGALRNQREEAERNLKENDAQNKKLNENIKLLDDEFSRQKQTLATLYSQIEAAQQRHTELIAEQQQLQLSVAELKTKQAELPPISQRSVTTRKNDSLDNLYQILKNSKPSG
jgi:ribonuclease HI